MTYRDQQCHCLTALPTKMSVFNSHVQGSHSVILNHFAHQKKHIRTIIAHQKKTYSHHNAILDKQKII